jgi:hypothetical protein
MLKRIYKLVKFILKITLTKKYFKKILVLKSEYSCFIGVFIHNLRVHFKPNHILKKTRNLKGSLIKVKKISNNLYFVLNNGQKNIY